MQKYPKVLALSSSDIGKPENASLQGTSSENPMQARVLHMSSSLHDHYYAPKALDPTLH